MASRISKEEFIARSNKLFNSKYDYSLIEYFTTLQAKYAIICDVHGKFIQRGSDHVRGSGCVKCSRHTSLKKFKSEGKRIHNNKYEYYLIQKTEWCGLQKKYTIICDVHGKFIQRANDHINGYGCNECGKDKKKITVKDFLNRSKDKFDNKFRYPDLSKYNGLQSKIDVYCNVCNLIFNISVSNHLKGKGGCKSCKLKNNKITFDEFFKRANKVHSNKFKYIQDDNFDGSQSLIKIICNNHIEPYVFTQKVADHLGSKKRKGKGCKLCSNYINYSKDYVISEGSKIHNNKYDYSLLPNKVSSRTKIKIICTNHSKPFVFIQRADYHIRGGGCTKCVKRISKKEVKWLDSLGILDCNRQIRLKNIKKYEVDGYDPETNTVYEFLGSYYHGDPIKFNLNDYNKRAKTTFQKLYNKTIKKEIAIRKAGYNYQFIWESDFKNEN